MEPENFNGYETFHECNVCFLIVLLTSLTCDCFSNILFCFKENYSMESELFLDGMETEREDNGSLKISGDCYILYSVDVM